MLGNGVSRADDLSDSLQAMAQDSTIVINDDQEVQLIEPGNSGEHFPHLNSAVNKRIQKTILGQTLTSDSDGKGSYALGKVHNEVRDDKRKSDIRLASKSVQRLVDVIVALNFPGQEVKFVMEDDRGLEIERAERDKILIDAGAIELTEDYLLNRYDFDQGDFIIPEKTETAPTQFKFAKKNKFTEDQQAIEKLADNMPAQSPLKKTAIEAAIRAATSPEDLEARLAVVLADADITEFSQALEKSLFTADIMGYANAE